MIFQKQFVTQYIPSRLISYSVILPEHCEKTVFWLHGYQERAQQLLNQSVFEQMAVDYHTAIVFPDVPDTYYLNQPWNQCYTEDFLLQEFIPSVTQQLHLPSGKKNTFLAGISMGGFGSLLLGSHRPDLFCKIGSISGAFILDDIAIGNPEIVGSPSNLAHFQNLFGDLPSLSTDIQRNPMIGAQSAHAKKLLPPIFLACGKQDLLYKRNQKLFKEFSNWGVDVTWAEDTGTHHWNFFVPAVRTLFQWFG